MRFTITFFLSIIYINSQGQLKSIICGKIKSDHKFNINFYEPIYGYNNVAFFDSTKQNNSVIEGKDSVYKVIQIDNPSFIKIYFKDENNQFLTLSDVLLFPGDSLHIDFDLNIDNPNSFRYTGSNAMGQKLFNEINYQPYNKFIPVFDVLDELPSNRKTLTKEIDRIVLSVINRFDTLQKNSLVTKKYVEYMSVCFKALFYNEVIKKYLRPGKQREVISKRERDSVIEIFFIQQSPNDLRLKGLYLSNFYINNYYNYLAYKKYNLNSIKPLTEGDKIYTINKHDYLIKEDFVPFIYIIDEKKREDLWGLELINFLEWLPGKYDESTIRQYDSIFPKNKWDALFKTQLKNKYTLKNIGYTLQLPIKFIDTLKKINSIDSLFGEMPKDTPVFIDIWATWCGPCISAFGYNRQLDSFLIKKSIEKLYISFDNAEDSIKWKEGILKYSLGGYHILATDELKSDIKRIIYQSHGNEGMGIPRYVVIDKNRKIVINDAYSPTDFNLLKEQITKFLP